MGYVYRKENNNSILVADKCVQADWEDENILNKDNLLNSAHILNKPQNIRIIIQKISSENMIFYDEFSDLEAFYFTSEEN